jgi:hypothetical protein
MTMGYLLSFCYDVPVVTVAVMSVVIVVSLILLFLFLLLLQVFLLFLLLLLVPPSFFPHWNCLCQVNFRLHHLLLRR